MASAVGAGGGLGGGGGGSGGAPEDADFGMLRKSPAFWAKLGHHPYWPAKAATKEERQRYSSYQRKSTQVCVKFYGSNDIGWVHPSALVGFEEGLRKSFHKSAKLVKNAKFVAGVEEATRVWGELHGSGASSASHGYYPNTSPMYGADGGGGGYTNGFGHHRGGEAFHDCSSDAHRGAAAASSSSSDPFLRAPWLPMHQHLQGNGEEAAAFAAAGVKRGRGRPPRSAAGGSVDAAEARKRRASLALAAASERRARFGGGAEEGDDESVYDDQEGECFVCKEPGMLIVCDAPSCRKAYHKPCLGLTAWGNAFFCPRHRCAVCRVSEAGWAKRQQQEEEQQGEQERGGAASVASSSETETEAEESSRKGKGARPPSASTAAQQQQQRSQLWKCAECPVSYCPEHLPPGINYYPASARPTSSSTASTAGGGSDPEQEGGRGGGQQRQQRLCGHCRTPSPRVQLAAILERSWARLATNYLALPFMRPFLHGAADSDDLLDLVGVALRIRGLRYATAEEYLGDLRVLQGQARRVAGDGPTAAPVREAIETLVGNAARFLDAVRKEVVPAESLIQEEEAGAPSSSSSAAVVAAGREGVSPGCAWRAELAVGEEQEALSEASGGALRPEYCPARTLEEWADYLAKAPMLYVETQQPLANRGGAEDDEGLERGEIARVLAQMRFEDGYPHKSTLLHRDHLESALEQQSTLLRRCLEGHAQLRRSLQEEKAVVLEFSASHARKRRRVEQAQGAAQGEDGMEVVEEEEGEGDGDGELDDDSHVVTMGDMHILKELQVANQNLRARLESKDALLRQREAQLSVARAAFLELQGQNAQLREQVERLTATAASAAPSASPAPATASEPAPPPPAPQQQKEAAATGSGAAAEASMASPPEGTEEAKGREEAFPMAVVEPVVEEGEEEEEEEGAEGEGGTAHEETDRAETTSSSTGSPSLQIAGDKTTAEAGEAGDREEEGLPSS